MWTRVMRTGVGEKNVAESMQAIGETDPWTMLAILGLTVLTVVTRSFFLWSEEKMPIPPWFQRGLHYAPVAAMAAVIVPEIVMQNGALISRSATTVWIRRYV